MWRIEAWRLMRICIQWVTPLFQHPEMRTPLYTVELLYSNTLKWGHLCIQWNSSIPTPWNEDTSVYSGTPLFQHPEMRTPLYTVELLYSNPLKWGHLCIQWNSSIPTPWNEDTSVYSGTPLFQSPWNEDTSVYSGTPLFQHPEMRTPLYTVELLYSNTLKWGHLCIKDTWICPQITACVLIEFHPLIWGYPSNGNTIICPRVSGAEKNIENEVIYFNNIDGCKYWNSRHCSHSHCNNSIRP